ncbi:Prokumamolisin, activation domain containing protein [Acanthamoeba castellanii str. Neff]|uniref:Prokumamolisin, activation domain containing protein n=1 Tax=Acanthamoeba castellanii (strain ATCC 30010 / Neff) TaxID=1257118 RepID=L8GJB2_ACACF|nr:Prokumamolisin, activation domain containing protein [Acanthamoeba castellanii str. Neff]ELR13130.1 Prokumamolisin, activation domain containing protein [Acanthamoeba castellanii str. Neff]
MSRKRAAPEGSLTFFVELNTGKEDLVARTAESVSDPKSPSYGKYLSAEELRELVAAPQEVEDHVTQWLHATRIAHDEPLEVESYGDVLRVSTTVQNTEQLFDTQLAHFTHSESQRSAVLITSSATLPVDISQYVRGVVGLAEVMTSHHVTRWANKNQKVLRAYYNVSSDLFASPEVSQGIISFNDAFSPKALQTFCEAFDLNVPEVIQVNGVDSNVPGTSGRVLAYGESDLDVQYITAMARNATTYHHNNDNAEFGFYWWALEVAASPNPAMVYSMSWGMDETSLRGRKVHSITSMDDKLARLALRGITILASAAFGWLFSRPTDLNPVREFLRKQEGCNATVEWDNAGQPWLYSECECSDFKWMDLGTARFRDWTPATASWPKLTAAYPASSEEIVGAYGPDSISYYTTGGGFSAIFPRQPWQEGSVSAYLANDSIQSELPPTSVYRAEGRAFPDISLVGANYLIAYAGPTGKDEPLLGFLNPILYQMARDRPEAFHDVVTGSNKGTTGYTCQYGWPAASGWDAASGLGTPNFGIMADYLLNFDAC